MEEAERAESQPEAARAPFAYAVIRVVPRVERGERLNAGIVLLCPPRRFPRGGHRARRGTPARARPRLRRQRGSGAPGPDPADPSRAPDAGPSPRFRRRSGPLAGGALVNGHPAVRRPCRPDVGSRGHAGAPAANAGGRRPGPVRTQRAPPTRDPGPVGSPCRRASAPGTGQAPRPSQRPRASGDPVPALPPWRPDRETSARSATSVRALISPIPGSARRRRSRSAASRAPVQRRLASPA